MRSKIFCDSDNKIKPMKHNFKILLLLCLLGGQYLNAQSCSCTEYVYLNEVSNGGAVHKYAINADGSLTEVSGANGFPWYSSTDWPVGEQLPSPHGLGMDLNGFIYIGETIGGDLRQLNCEGEITPAAQFEIVDGGTNLATIGNNLYMTSYYNGNSGLITAYDLCTGQSLGAVNIVGNHNSWGFFVDENGSFYSTVNSAVDTERGIAIYTPTLADFAAGTTYPVMFDLDTTNIDPSVGDIGIVPRGELRGITTDNDGNIYMVLRIRSSTYQPNQTICSAIYKYAPDGTILAISTDDCAGDGAGWNYATGIGYSETCDCIFVSTESPDDDCIYRFNKNLTNTGITGSAVGPVPGGLAKGMAINTECCPVPSTGNIDKVVCISSIGEQISLNEAYCGDGIMCGASIALAGPLTGMTFDACSNFITITDNNACGEFVIGGTNSQCGSYDLTVKITAILTTDPIIQGEQTICTGAEPDPLTVTSSVPDATFQWQVSTDSCDGPWTNVAGATTSSFTPTLTSANNFYRVVMTEASTGCASGNCETYSNCVTITEEECCINPTAPAISVTDNTCNPVANGSFNIDTPCETGSTLEWSTDGGATWSTTMPTWSDGVSVIARCVDDGDATCFSTNSNEVTATLQACTTYDIALTKMVDQAQATVGSNVVFTITVENLGDAVTNAIVNDVLPTGLTYVSDLPSTGTYDGTDWTIGNLAVGQTENIQITATVNAEGVLLNEAVVSINETETNLDNNEDNACVSVPIQICDNETIDVDLVADAGLPSYQWYKDGVAIAGATSATYKATEAGTYTYTTDGVGPTGDCIGELCCPIVIEQVSCCPPILCLPVTITKLN